MTVDPTSLLMKLFFGVVKFIPYVFGALFNYCKRPRLRLSISNVSIEFCTAQGQKQLPSFLSINIHNLESVELHLDLNRVVLNSESLDYVIQQNPFFARTHEGTHGEVKLTTKNTLLNLFRENWIGSKFLKIPAHETLSIPIHPHGISDQMYFRVKQDAKIFFVKNKFIVALNINSHDYHYSVNRFDLIKRLVNSLVHC